MFIFLRFKIVKKRKLPKETYRFNVISITVPMACFTEIGKKSPNSLGITKDPEYPKTIMRKNRARDTRHFLTSKYIIERHDSNEGSHGVPVSPHLRPSLNTGGRSPMARLLGGAPGATSLWEPGSQARDQV